MKPAAAGEFSIDLPIEAGSVANQAYGLWPFGVHGSSHAADGHPGWDLEFRPGSRVLAAADGEVQSILDGEGGKQTVQIMHRHGARSYRSVYTNLTQVGALTAGARVSRGQPLGLAGVQTQKIGTQSVTFAMIHFQLDDFSFDDGRGSAIGNNHAVSPENYLSPQAKQLFAAIWKNAAYQQEIAEPLASNPRQVSAPLQRVWKLEQGSGPAELRIEQSTPGQGQYGYALIDQAGEPIETGTLALEPSGEGISHMDLHTPGSLTHRHGHYDIQGDILRLHLADHGESLSESLDQAAVYRLQP